MHRIAVCARRARFLKEQSRRRVGQLASSLCHSAMFLAVGLLTACSVPHSDTPCLGQFVFYGQATDEHLHLLPEEEQAVVWVHFVSTGSPPCSGVLIGRQLVLTAAHCAGQASPGMPIVRIGPDALSSPTILNGVDWEVHPSLDVGLITLEAQVAAHVASPLNLSTLPTSSLLGARAVIAGYGITEENFAGQRRFAAERVTAVNDVFLVLDGAGESGACLGDSGGPVLWWEGSAPTVLGVLESGDPSCMGEDRYTSLEPVRNWIAQRNPHKPLPSTVCGSLDYAGHCLQSEKVQQAVWCEGEVRSGKACPNDQKCAWDSSARGYRCVTESELCGIDD